MTCKLMGALLIFAAGGSLLAQLSRQRSREMRFLSDMAAAMEQMESAIRFRRLPMPELLREQASRTYCGKCFLLIIQYMESGNTLQTSWIESVRTIPWPQAKTVLLSLELTGDARRICENLRACACSLRELLRRQREEQQEKQKTTLALTASACGLLVILLL